MTKDELVKELIDNHGYDSSIEVLEEEQLQAQLDIEKELIGDLDSVEEVEDEPEDVEPEESYTAPGSWNDYVMSQFEQDELYDGNPTVDALRRVTEELIGEIVECTTKVEQVPTPENNERATVVVTVSVLTKGKEGIVKIFSGAADAFAGNLPQGFERYPVAFAETRAESRALRKILRLRNVSAEELGANGAVKSNESPLLSTTLVAPINDNQKSAIDITAKRLNVNVEKLIKYLATNLVLDYDNLKELSHTDGGNLVKALSGYQANTNAIPIELIGYKADWRTK